MADTTATNRWRGVVAVTLVAGAVGLVARRPAILLVAVLGVAYAAYPRLTRIPALDLTLDRRLSEPNAVPGSTVTVEVTLRNEGSTFLPDLRLVDGVPDALPVVDGTPRHGTALRPGESTTFTYGVEARYGRHRFDPATVVATDLSGARERRTTVADDTELASIRKGTETPVARAANRAAGQFTSGAGGTGVEFSHSREYRTGDPASHIDWHRFARRRELTTVLYRKERAQTVVLMVDARPAGYRGLDGGPNAVTAGVSAAEQLATSLIEGRNRVGLVALGWPGCWLGPATGRDHLLRVRERLATHHAFGPHPPDEATPLDAQIEELRARLPDDAQPVVLSPLCDDAIVDGIQRLEANGFPVTVISPDVTARDSPGRRLAALERAGRVSTLRRADLPVLEWSPTDPFARAVSSKEAASWG